MKTSFLLSVISIALLVHLLLIECGARLVLAGLANAREGFWESFGQHNVLPDSGNTPYFGIRPTKERQYVGALSTPGGKIQN